MSQVKATMQATRGSHIYRIRGVAHKIFGRTDLFKDSRDKDSDPVLQGLLGVTITPGGKKYALLPPILYPNELPDKDTLFLNPPLAKVRIVAIQGSLCISHLHAQR
jgi:hypothetical protein